MNKLLLCVALLGMGGIYGARAEDPPITAADDLIATRQADMAIQTSLLEAIMMAIGADADIMSFKDAASAIEALGAAIPELFPEGTERGHNTRAPPRRLVGSSRVRESRRQFGGSRTPNGECRCHLQSARVRQSQPRDSRSVLHVPHGISRRPYQTVVWQPPGSGRCWTAIQFPCHEVARLHLGMSHVLQPIPPSPGLLGSAASRPCTMRSGSHRVGDSGPSPKNICWTG